MFTANVGDWYIDIVNKKIYYKNANGWEEIFSIGNNTPPTTLKGDYILSRDGTTLYIWLNRELNSIDMQADPELSRVTTIGAYAFESLPELTQIKLPNGLKKISTGAFYSSRLSSITIPNSVVSIGEDAFYGNEIASITIPSSVKSIGVRAFSSNKFTSVKVEAITPPTTVTEGGFWNGFIYNNNLTTISVPQQSVEAYKKAEGWKEYADKIQGY